MIPKISVIVPVYNVVDFLPKCINSILNQKFMEFELLLVDDGSHDGSEILCDDYADKDPRIRVMHKINGGVSSARNIGIENALGEYIQFIDSDDYLEGNMFEQLYIEATQTGADIIVVDFFRDNDYIIQSLSNMSGLSLLKDMFQGKVIGALWNKFIKRDLLNFRCNERLSYCEDFHLLTRIITSRELKVYHYNQAFYHYVTRNNSLTNNISDISIRHIEDYIKSMKHLLQRFPEFLPFLDNNQTYMRIIALKGNLYSWNEYQRRFPKMQTFALIQNRHISLSYKLKIVLFCSCFYFGWRFVSMLLVKK